MRSFVVTSAAILFLGVHAGCQPAGTRSTTDIVFVQDDTRLLNGKLRDGAGLRFQFVEGALDTARFRKSSAAYWLHVNENVLANNTVELIFKELPPASVQAYITSEVGGVLEAMKKAVTPDPEHNTAWHTRVNVRLYALDQ